MNHMESIGRNIDPDPKKCNFDKCLNKGTKKCDRCKKARYCSRACQVEDWKKSHKAQCQKTEQNSTVSSSERSAKTVPPVVPSNPQVSASHSHRGHESDVGTDRVTVRLSLADLERLTGGRVGRQAE